MILNHQFRRAAAVAASAVAGVAAALVFAAPASAHTGKLTAEASCTDTGWNATWTLKTSDTGGHEGVLSNVKASLGYKLVPPSGGMDGGNHGGRTVPGLTEGTKVTGDTTVEGTLRLGQSVTDASLALTITWKVGEDTHTETLQAKATAPSDCDWPEQPERPEPSKLTHSSDCTSLTVTVANPEKGRQVRLALKPSTGEQRVLAIEPGETKSEKFDAAAGFTVEVTDEDVPPPPGGKPTTVSYEQPDSCDAEADGTPDGAAGEGGGDGPTLPVTGANAGTVAIAAVALLAAGAALFAVSRRRRMKFTA